MADTIFASRVTRLVRKVIASLLVTIALAMAMVCNVKEKVSAVTPSAVQTCKSVNGGTAKQHYIIVIGSSGGSTGCTSNFAPFNMIILAYNQSSTSTDRT